MTYISDNHNQSNTRAFPKILFALVVTAALCGLSIPSVLAASPPGAGQILKEIPAPPTPAPKPSPGLTITPHKAGKAPTGETFRVDHIRITGNTLFSTERLHALVAAGEGRELNLAEADALAQRITRFYQKHGYPLDRAYIPAQKIQNATLTIAVLEARYGKVILKNSTRVGSSLLDATLSPIRQGESVSLVPLNRSLLLLNEIPGVTVSSTLSPGEKPGTSDLTVDANRQPQFTGNVGIDDYGDRYTGRARLSANLAISNPLHWGDQLNIGGLTSGDRLNYGRMGYTSVVNGWGTILGASGSFLHYRLGRSLKDLGAHGNAITGEALMRQPVIRTVNSSIDMQLTYDYKRLHDDISSTGIHDDRHINALNITFSGNFRDGWGVSNASLTLTGGRVSFDDGSARQADAIGADTQGNYGRADLAVGRLQPITESNSLYVSASGQLASENLDSSEKFYLGGPGSISGYDPATIGGDEGVQVSAELRHDFRFQIPGLWRAVAFVNEGYVRVNKHNGYTSGSNNSANLSSAGVGLNWQWSHELSASISVATPFGGKPGLLAGESRPTRFWAQIQKGF